MRIPCLCLIASALLAVQLAAGAAPTPLLWQEAFPGLGFHLIAEVKLGSIERMVVPDSVAGGTAMKVIINDLGVRPGMIMREMGGDRGFGPADTAVSFWLKGDGSTNVGEISTSYGRGTGSVFRFSLKEGYWHRLVIPFASFQPPYSGKETLSFSIQDGAKLPSWYIIDKLEGTTETAPSAADKAQEDKLKAQVGPADIPWPTNFADYAVRKDKLAAVVAKLKAKQPVKLAVMGASESAGAQLWAMGPKERQEAAIWHAVLAAELREKYGYDGVTVLNVSIGGQQAQHGTAKFDKEVAPEKPDVVFISYGGNDSNYSNLSTYKQHMQILLDKTKAIGAVPVFLQVLLFTDDPKRTEPFNAHVTALAEQDGLPLVKLREYFVSKGLPYYGDFLNDTVHWSYPGQRKVAEIAFTLFE
jgi:hypothetical protein